MYQTYGWSRLSSIYERTDMCLYRQGRARQRRLPHDQEHGRKVFPMARVRQTKRSSPVMDTGMNLPRLFLFLCVQSRPSVTFIYILPPLQGIYSVAPSETSLVSGGCLSEGLWPAKALASSLQHSEHTFVIILGRLQKFKYVF